MVYSPLSDSYIVVYQSAIAEGTTSDIGVRSFDAEGALIFQDNIDKTKKRLLTNPRISASSACSNELIVYEDYNELIKRNDLGSYYLGDPCKFALNILKSGDGSGNVLSEPSGIDCGTSCTSEFGDGEKVTLTAIPDESSLFGGFAGTQCADESVCYVIMDSSKSVDANFILKEFQITTIVNGTGGKILPENPVVKYGKDITFTFLPDNGYEVEDVMVDGNSVGTASEYTLQDVREEHTIAATFRENQISYTVTATASDGGTITPKGDVKVKSGESIKFTMTPDKGYYLKYLEVDGIMIAAQEEYTFENVSSDHSIYARFEPYLDEWEIDGGLNEDAINADEKSSITEVKNEKESGCGCTFIE